MNLFDAVILGTVQGLTEFLPVSSSGHLILARKILDLELAGSLGFDAVLQFATTLAILVYFHRDIGHLIRDTFRFIFGKAIDGHQKILIYAILIGTIPAGIIGYFLEDIMDSVFRNSFLVALMLIVGSIIMFIAEKTARHTQTLTPRSGFVVGFFQALALIPGMSRSGMTIAGGLFMGLSRGEATRFSFLLAIPILFGSGLKEVLAVDYSNLVSIEPLIAGSITSFIIGILTISFLLHFVKHNSLYVFVWYRIALACLMLLIL